MFIVKLLWEGCIFMLIEDVLKEFVFECKIKKLSERTVKSYKNNTSSFIIFSKNAFEVKEVEEINHLHIKQYFNYLMNKGLRESYINGILKCLRAFFKYVKTEEYILKCPCEKVS